MQVRYGTYDESHALRKVFTESKDPLLKRMNKYFKKQGQSVLVGTTGEGKWQI